MTDNASELTQEPVDYRALCAYLEREMIAAADTYCDIDRKDIFEPFIDAGILISFHRQDPEITEFGRKLLGIDSA